MRNWGFLAVVFVAAWLSGCAHSIAISPNLSDIQGQKNARQLPYKVGYYISPEQKALEVTTPGGGGDKVSYHPYGDLEPALYFTLSQSFDAVEKLDTAVPENHDVDFVLIPTIKTNSSSTGVFTWPPTDFSVELSCSITRADGTPVDQIQVTGKGHAEYSEFIHDFSLSGKRASEDMLTQLQATLLTAPVLNGPAQPQESR